MKFPILTLTIVSLSLAIFGSGCKGHEEDPHPHAASEAGNHTEISRGVTFSEKHGLEVPEETAKFIGLQIADVEERKVASTYRFTAQVFRAAQETRFASTQPSAALSAEASAFVPESDARKLREGQSVVVELPGATIKVDGKISRIVPLEKANNQSEVLISIRDPEGRAGKGTFVTAVVPTGGEKSVVSIPKSSLLKTAEGTFVYTVSGNHYVRTPIQVGVVNGEHVEVTDGLFAGDQVVVRPVMSLWLAELQAIRGGKACADGH